MQAQGFFNNKNDFLTEFVKGLEECYADENLKTSMKTCKSTFVSSTKYGDFPIPKDTPDLCRYFYHDICFFLMLFIRHYEKLSVKGGEPSYVLRFQIETTLDHYFLNENFPINASNAFGPFFSTETALP